MRDEGYAVLDAISPFNALLVPDVPLAHLMELIKEWQYLLYTQQADRV